MGEQVALFRPEFNGAVRIETRGERLSGDAGAFLLREADEKVGLTRWLVRRVRDSRDQDFITHPMSELLRTNFQLLAEGWRDADDADSLRDDPALRLSVSDRRGVSPLKMRPSQQRERDHNPVYPDGLASQPTLSRLAADLSSAWNRGVLRKGLCWMTGQRVRAMNGGRKLPHLTIDIDSLPIEVHGHQPGSEHNGHYRRRIYHPLIATAAELGDLLDVQLRVGNAHTAEGGLWFISDLLGRAEKYVCEKASVRIDAGFPEDGLLSFLERRGTPYVARVINNKRLTRMALPHLKRPVGRPPKEPRVWFHEKTYQAKSWSKPRRAVLVVLERPGELFLHHFWLITSWTPEEMSAADLLELYRQRGTAESHFGELMDVLDPALSSTTRLKSHYRGKVPQQRTEPVHAFEVNEVRLILAALAYNLMHVPRTLIQAATGQGWSLRRVRERLLRVPARLVVHARSVTVVITEAAASLWSLVLPRLAAWPAPS